MNWRVMLILIALAALGGLGYWLDGVLPLHGWSVLQDGQWHLTVQGWPLLLHAWPVALGGLLIGGSGLFLLLSYSYATAEDADHQAELQAMRQEVEAANAWAIAATREAEDIYRAKMEAAEQRENAAARAQQEANAARQRAEHEIMIAHRTVEQIQLEIQHAERKKNNAMAAMKRLKYKIARLTEASPDTSSS